jgi:cell division protease FtsH
MKYETIDSAQINDIMSGKRPQPPADWIDDSDSSPKSGGGDDLKADVVDKPKGDSPDGIGGPAGQH